MLRVGAPRAEIIRIGALLRELFANDSEGFHALFDPAAPRIGVGGVAPALAAGLRRAGLVAGDDEALRGLHRIRRIDDRFYLLELGDGPEYVQDVWPETDALLAVVAGAPPGRLADVGTGSGVLAIEAARAGHRVVATDLYDETLALARFNAIVNDVALDLRRGHLFEPLWGLTFDRIVTAPHYGHEADQLRLEVLRDGPAHLAPGGTLALATALEWHGDGPLAVEPLLAAGAARGVAARVTPIDGGAKRHWFARAVGDERVPSRHRFLVQLTRAAAPAHADLPQTGAARADAPMGAAPVSVQRPAATELEAEVHVPLARLAAAPRGATWTVTTPADVAALGALLADVNAPRFRFDAPLPAALLDACRYGARPCVAPRGQAAGAILDVDGGVRPCAHGAPIAAAGDSLADLRRAQEALAARAFARRGCRDCRALDSCSRCLFPVGFADERDYCEFMRAHVNDLSRLRRLVATLARLDAAPPLTIERWPRRAFAADSDDFAVGDAWNQAEAWLIEHPGGHRLFWLRDGELWDAALSPDEALAGASLADGTAPPLPPERLEPAVARLAALLAT